MSILHSTCIGIDLSDHHLRIARLGWGRSSMRLEEIELPEGFVVDEKIVQPVELKAFVQKELKRREFTDSKRRACVLVPESRVFSHSLLLPLTTRYAERQARARDLAQREIPIPFTRAQIAYSEGAKEAGQVRGTMYAVEKDVFEPLISTFGDSLHLIAMEANSKALLRVLQRFGKQHIHTLIPESLIAMVDIGHSWTSITLYTHEGSNLFSRTLPHRLKEKVDLKHPLLPKRIVDMIIDTLRETMVFYESQKKKIGMVVFAGVEAQDDRLKTEIAEQKIPLQAFLIWEIVKIGGVSKQQVHTFGACIGAALRCARVRQYGYQHNFLAHR